MNSCLILRATANPTLTTKPNSCNICRLCFDIVLLKPTGMSLKKAAIYTEAYVALKPATFDINAFTHVHWHNPRPSLWQPECFTCITIMHADFWYCLCCFLTFAGTYTHQPVGGTTRVRHNRCTLLNGAGYCKPTHKGSVAAVIRHSITAAGFWMLCLFWRFCPPR